MKKTIIAALFMAPVLASAARYETPVLQLMDGELVAAIGQGRDGHCPAFARFALFTFDAPGVSQGATVTVRKYWDKDDQGGTCISRLTGQNLGLLRDGTQLWARVSILGAPVDAESQNVKVKQDCTIRGECKLALADDATEKGGLQKMGETVKGWFKGLPTKARPNDPPCLESQCQNNNPGTQGEAIRTR